MSSKPPTATSSSAAASTCPSTADSSTMLLNTSCRIVELAQLSMSRVMRESITSICVLPNRTSFLYTTSRSQAIYKFDLLALEKGGVIIAGSVDESGLIDGPALDALFFKPAALLWDEHRKCVLIGEQGAIRTLRGAAIGGTGPSMVGTLSGAPKDGDLVARGNPNGKPTQVPLVDARWNEIERMWQDEVDGSIFVVDAYEAPRSNLLTYSVRRIVGVDGNVQVSDVWYLISRLEIKVFPIDRSTILTREYDDDGAIAQSSAYQLPSNPLAVPPLSLKQPREVTIVGLEQHSGHFPLHSALPKGWFATSDDDGSIHFKTTRVDEGTFDTQRSDVALFLFAHDITACVLSFQPVRSL